ncbi:pentatricopeptide repeat-containing protein At3g62890-like [Asparagus officinalis]|nr:pentatricopeptide repeat-containing protein At3g62890-like [Asparagus officinalis]
MARLSPPPGHVPISPAPHTEDTGGHPSAAKVRVPPDDLGHRSTLSETRGPPPLLFNAIIRGHSRFGSPHSVLQMFVQMLAIGLAPDHYTFPFVLKASADIPLFPLGQSIHSLCLILGFEGDRYVGSSLINMYVKCGDVGRARKVFDGMFLRDASCWNALIDGYMKTGDVRSAEEVFGTMRETERNVVSWTAMIAGYSQNGVADRALGLFDEFLMTVRSGCDGVRPNWMTVASVLPACAQAGALEQGRRIHRYATDMGLDRHVGVQIALVTMYAKCGSLRDAHSCFDRICIDDKDVVAWNAMITAYTSHGMGTEAVETFEDMIRSRVAPDAITFTSLLSGCSHGGLVDRGMKYFESMKANHNVEPRSEHYACVVDLMARAGRLDEALGIIERMDVEPGASVWGALLSACRTHRNLDIAEIAAKRLFMLEPENCGNYALLSNMYANVGRWEEAKRLRSLLKERGVKKSPGCSWIEINGKAHAFFCGKNDHPEMREIYMFLEDLPKRIRAAGYVPDISFVLHDVSEEEKECNLMTHSEKLAVAFGILRTRAGAVLRVTKNLRICGDCHMMIKFVSKVYEREIIVRDVNRFHCFKAGVCSCRDYW